MRTPRPRGRPSGTRSKYRAVADDIAKKISSGTFPIGKPLPTWSALAKSYNVGQMTVGQAMNVLKREGFIHAGPRQRPVVRLGLSFEDVFEQSIGIVTHTFLDCIIRPQDTYWIAALLRGITLAAMESSSTLLTLQGPQWRKAFPAGLVHVPLQGLLLLACPFKPEMFKQYQALQARYPVVTLDEHSEYLHSVALDNYAIVRDATLRMIALGHRRIAFVRPYHASPVVRNIDVNAKQRTEAFTAACREAGLAPDEHAIFSANASMEVSGGSFRDMVRAEPRFTAVLAMDHALQVAQEAKRVGLHVPRDLSIVGFSQHLPSRWSGPVVDFEAFGAKGVELIRSKPRTLQHVRMPAAWNEGETAGPAP
ncbi:MAG: GntR family transcriptional regulator [Planctomycetes bacterium]|nr:GntR family transcriptional regulator [Planctomycetota bacterium]